MPYRISSFISIDSDLTDEEVLEELKKVTTYICGALVETGYENDLNSEESKPKSIVAISYLGEDMEQWIHNEVENSIMIVMPTKDEDEDAS